ncbi:cation:H+ antiporter [Alkalibacillus filiformis]|uniref:Cation:H+ antiporter n=1 Tax=Alkalibacillus filiformis TaxID=200990 RepID=A0ABU0DX49_9BACI|nr:sodium:calcium antiporter [Alkalibacillus filiformis]MDQ0353028.1 cation:H+ antiporter [Alkalibacillus filiformis]
MVIYISFTLAAILVVFAAIKLNEYGDQISRQTAMSGAMVGGLLIAGATSLPELTTSVTAVYIDNVDIAVGNMLGSNVFNLLIIASVDLYYRKLKAFNTVEPNNHFSPIIFGIILTSTVTIAMVLDLGFSIFNIGFEMYILVALYIISVKLFESEEPEEPVEQYGDVTPTHKVIRYFIFSAIAVLLAGSVLSISGDLLAAQTGINSSFVGSVLIAASTSLPELVAVIAAYKIGNYAIAVGSILGSNLFNLLLLAFTDAFYQQGPILQGVSYSMIVIAALSLVMMLFTLYMLMRSPTQSTFKYIIPSIAIIAIYLIVSYITF